MAKRNTSANMNFKTFGLTLIPSSRSHLGPTLGKQTGADLSLVEIQKIVVHSFKLKKKEKGEKSIYFTYSSTMIILLNLITDSGLSSC